MGVMAVGMGRFVTPFKSSTTESTEGTEEFFETLISDAPFVAGLRDFSSCSSVSCVVFFFLVLSSLAMLSASQPAFTLPRDAFLLLCHSAESSSPAIWAMVLLLSTEVSYLSMSKGSTT